MNQTILVINCGSSSVKFSVLDPRENKVYLSGLVENIEMSSAKAHWRFIDHDKCSEALPDLDYASALKYVSDVILQDASLVRSIVAVGHRVVHGGEAFSQSVIINDDVAKSIEACNDLAPLHNPANLMGVEFFANTFPDLPQIAVFDTAFHQTMPKHAYLYALPYELYEKYNIRRYGFHGTSHRYVSMKAAEELSKPLSELNLITAHLGNGCSLAAIHHGESVDTTMGLTPLEGLVMGTRSGDVDPGLHAYLLMRLNMTIEDIDNLLNKKSGLLGVSQKTSDMRELHKLADEGDELAQLALEIFCYSLAKHIASMRVALPSLDALIFTGGIGENDKEVRTKTLKLLSFLDMKEVMVIPTDEELMIAKDTWQLLAQ